MPLLPTGTVKKSAVQKWPQNDAFKPGDYSVDSRRNNGSTTTAGNKQRGSFLYTVSGELQTNKETSACDTIDQIYVTFTIARVVS